MKAPTPSRRKPKGPKSVPEVPAGLSIEAAILGVLQQQDRMRIEQLVRALPGYTWRQVFNAVDSLRKDAALTVTQPDELSYRVSLNRAGHC